MREPNLEMTQFFISTRLTNIEAKSRLASYILPTSRIPTSGMDKILFIKSAKCRHLAIAWRRQALGVYSRCDPCGKTFRRPHISSCHSAITQNGPYEEHLSYSGPSANYSYLDYLLNAEKYEEFERCWMTISDSLSPMRAQTP